MSYWLWTSAFQIRPWYQFALIGKPIFSSFSLSPIKSNTWHILVPWFSLIMFAFFGHFYNHPKLSRRWRPLETGAQRRGWSRGWIRLVGGRSEGADSPGMSALFEHLSERGIQVNQLLFFLLRQKLRLLFPSFIFLGVQTYKRILELQVLLKKCCLLQILNPGPFDNKPTLLTTVPPPLGPGTSLLK